MLKRWLCVCLALLLFLMPASGMAGEAELEQETVQASEEGVEENETAGENGFSLTLMKEDLEKLAKYFDMGFGLISSPEFQELFQYVEVQNLTKEVIKRVGRFAVDDPELVRKILLTLGVEEKYTDLLTTVLQWLDKLDNILNEPAKDEITQAIQNVYRNIREETDIEKLRAFCYDLYMELCQLASIGELPE